MPWVTRILHGKRVHAQCDDSGALVVEDGRVSVVYKLSASATTYKANPNNLRSTGAPSDKTPVEAEIAPKDPVDSKSAKSKSKSKSKSLAVEGVASALPDDAVVVYTDGACTGNPGPMGIGVVIMDGDDRRELSEFLGEGTNNVAELTAILRALEELPEARHRTVAVHSDSAYSIGLLTKGWKAKANKELVARLRELSRSFEDLRLVKVKGHAGIPENERADELARAAVENA